MPTKIRTWSQKIKYCHAQKKKLVGVPLRHRAKWTIIREINHQANHKKEQNIHNSYCCCNLWKKLSPNRDWGIVQVSKNWLYEKQEFHITNFKLRLFFVYLLLKQVFVTKMLKTSELGPNLKLQNEAKLRSYTNTSGNNSIKIWQSVLCSTTFSKEYL